MSRIYNYGNPPQHRGMVRRRPWPWWARLLRRLRSRSDRGIGDTLERLLSCVGGRYYKRAWKAAGKPCRCGRRQNKLNYRYPYEIRTPQAAA
jgi:hypothetical protein